MNAFDKITRNAGPVKNKGLVTNMRVMILALLGWFGAVVPISSQQVSKDMLYLHTDRSWYISGDQVYFKSYLLPGKSPASTVAASQSPEGILYVWFLDLHGTEVWKISDGPGYRFGRLLHSRQPANGFLFYCCFIYL